MTKKFLPLLKIAWKDARGSKKQLFFYSSGLLLGIAIIVFSLAVRGQVMQVLDSEALAVLGADLSIRSKDPISRDSIQTPKTAVTLSEVRFRSMVLFADGNTRLTQVRASEKGYPFYGQVQTNPESSWEKLNDQPRQALLDESLLLSSGAVVGETIKIGKSDFTIIGSVTKIPGTSLFNSAVAPRIYISYQDAQNTGLLSRQSIADYFLYLKLGSAKAEIEKISKSLSSEYTIETAEQRRERLGAINDNILTYFSLVGLACIILGALGASTSVYFYLQGKLRDAAILKCLGLRGIEVAFVYLTQLLTVSFFTSLLASICGTLAFFVLIPKLANFFSVPIIFSFPLMAFILGLIVGVVTIILAAVPGILILKKSSALVLLREVVSLKLSRYEKFAILIAGLATGPIFLLLLSPAKEAFIYGTVLNIVMLVLWSSSLISKKIALKTARLKLPFTFKYALLGLSRPGNATTVLINAFSLSTILAATLFLVQHYIAAQVTVIKDERTANLFIYDVPEDQVGNIRKLLEANSVQVAEEVPIVLMRIKSIKDKDTATLLREGNTKIPAWTLKRDYWTSYRQKMLANEDLLVGEWVAEYDESKHGAIIPISIDAKLAKNLQVELGDRIEFDVQGVPFITEIASLRKIHWEQMQRNAFVVFPSGVLEDAPKFLFLTAHVPDTITSANLQRNLVQQFAGISVVDIRFVADTLLPMLDKIAQSVIALASLVILTASIILITAIFSSKGGRNKEFELLRRLGATKFQTQSINFTEYFLLSLISSIIAFLLSLTLSFTLSKFIFRVWFNIPWPSFLVIFIASIVLVSSVSLVSNRFLPNR